MKKPSIEEIREAFSDVQLVVIEQLIDRIEELER